MSKKILIINHALVIPVFRHRWETMARESEYEVHVVIPKYWEQWRFSEKVIYENQDFSEGKYFVHALDTTNIDDPGTYNFKDLPETFKSISPDIIYMIGNEGMEFFQ